MTSGLYIGEIWAPSLLKMFRSTYFVIHNQNSIEMKYFLLTLLSFCMMSSSARANDSELKKNFVTGDPAISSISALTFGPEGILFIGDSDAAQIVAVDLSSHEAVDNSKVTLENVDGMIADLLGASKEDVQVTDMAVNPENNNCLLYTSPSPRDS